MQKSRGADGAFCLLRWTVHVGPECQSFNLSSCLLFWSSKEVPVKLPNILYLCFLFGLVEECGVFTDSHPVFIECKFFCVVLKIWAPTSFENHFHAELHAPLRSLSCFYTSECLSTSQKSKSAGQRETFSLLLHCSQTRTRQNWTLCVRLLPGRPDPSATMSGSEDEQEPRTSFKPSEALRATVIKPNDLHFFSSPQLFSDFDPPAEGEHRNRPAGPPSGCQERRTGGKHAPQARPRTEPAVLLVFPRGGEPSRKFRPFLSRGKDPVMIQLWSSYDPITIRSWSSHDPVMIRSWSGARWPPGRALVFRVTGLVSVWGVAFQRALSWSLRAVAIETQTTSEQSLLTDDVFLQHGGVRIAKVRRLNWLELLELGGGSHWLIPGL